MAVMERDNVTEQCAMCGHRHVKNSQTNQATGNTEWTISKCTVCETCPGFLHPLTVLEGKGR